MDGEAGRVPALPKNLNNEKKEKVMKEFGNDHKAAMKRSFMFVGIAESLKSYRGGINLETVLGGVFDTNKLETSVLSPLVELMEAEVDDEGIVAIMRFLLIEAFPEALRDDIQ